MLFESRENILQRITQKGGLLGLTAAMHVRDHEKGNDFLAECFFQAHNKSLWDFLGKDLVLDIVQYRLKFLRWQFEELRVEQSILRSR